ncbi:MAG: hypothetical protein FJX75_05665 [Armatimonadetes bacterium]|nr:hypothetical protein [Armatimonadota bacterium]
MAPNDSAEPMGDLHVPGDWLTLREELAAGPPAVLVVGGSDSGKSTFCRWLAAEWAPKGGACWLIDADVGQSQLGPPATVGAAPVGSSEAAAFFAGDVSPRRVLPQMLAAFAEAVRAAREAAAKRIVVDTTGWTTGPDAVALKVAKAALLGEAHVVLIEREDELRAFRRAWRGLARFPVHRLEPVPEVRRRSPEERRANREAAFRASLEGAVECEIDLRRVAASGIGSLSLPRPSVPTGLLLGLNDAGGRLLSLGVLERLDPATGRLQCLCRAEAGAAAEVRFGRLLLDPDGTHTSVADGGGPP